YESLYSYIHTGELATYHRSNIYYNGKINDWNIDFNADGLWNDTKNTQETDEKITEGTSGNPDRSVTTIDTKRNELYAAKLVVSRPLAKGNFSLGAEYSHNSRNTTYYNAEGIIENNEAQIKEGATSAFIQYDRRFNQIHLQTGLRYEHVAFDYYDAGKHVDEQSKKYNHVFPSISLSFPVKKIQMQLGYARDITRPSYWNLRTNTTYVNKYTYETGNPFLMPSISDNITWSTSYKWLNVYVGYSHIKDAIVNQTVTYSENDPTVSLLTVLNSPDYDKVSASVNLSPQMGIWNPRLNLYVEKQWYWAETPDGKEMFGTPLWMIRFSNNLRLPKGFLLDVTGSFVSKGHSENVCMNKPRVDMSASLHKSFFNESLIVQLNANNILESKQNVTIYSGIRSLQQTQVLHRQISLTLRYKFNTTQSKYKGTGAGQSQKKRM
ncbi:MAG: TonB-dependent receptor family protein, partial [Bacteroidaceae bacterium]|nr:TonB-dependent receptor family protein [Bacteroidaceae bacterium]